jgi:hypothetical protein
VTEVEIVWNMIDPSLPTANPTAFTDAFMTLCQHLMKSDEQPQCESWLALAIDLHKAQLREMEKISHNERTRHIAPSEFRGRFDHADLICRQQPHPIIKEHITIVFEPKPAGNQNDRS